MIGLAWAFFQAGADQVIGGLWEVNDTLATELMGGVYARIAAGADPARALRDAKLQIMKQRRHARPLDWAPFVIYGI
jgi:CHAT domain-containing protein